MDEIRASNNLVIAADKTSNFYLVPVDEYKALMQNNITQTHKKADPDCLANINKEASAIASKLSIDDRVDVFSTQEPFLSIKDHKENFPNRVSVRMINPSKSQICKISKKLLDNIMIQIKAKLRLNSWKSSSQVQNWFCNSADKKDLYLPHCHDEIYI